MISLVVGGRQVADSEDMFYDRMVVSFQGKAPLPMTYIADAPQPLISSFERPAPLTGGDLATVPMPLHSNVTFC
jgi:hypothetical protein